MNPDYSEAAAVAGAGGLTGTPTGAQELNYRIASEELAKLKALEADLKKFEAQLDAPGVPYTPGRLPEIG